jgi:hypothetical protein
MNELRLEVAFVTPLQVMKITEQPAILHPFLTIWYDQFNITVEGTTVMYALPVDKLVTMQVSYVDAAGNKAEVDGKVIWTSSDDDILTVKTDASDTTICTVTPAGQVGQAQVTAIADADMGTGQRRLVTICDIEVLAGEAVAGTIQPMGDPEPIAPHVEPRKK